MSDNQDFLMRLQTGLLSPFPGNSSSSPQNPLMGNPYLAANTLAEGQPAQIDIQGQTYEAIPADQFNHNSYGRLELYHDQYGRPRPNPPAFLIGNDPAEKPTPDNIKYWRRKAAPFYGS